MGFISIHQPISLSYSDIPSGGNSINVNGAFKTWKSSFEGFL